MVHPVLSCMRRWEPIAKHIEPGSILHTDGAQAYKMGVRQCLYYHDHVNHSAFQWTAFRKCGGGWRVFVYCQEMDGCVLWIRIDLP